MLAFFEGDEDEETRWTAGLRLRARVRDSDYAVLQDEARDAACAAATRAGHDTGAARGPDDRRERFGHIQAATGHARPLCEEGERDSHARTRPRFTGRSR